MWRLAIENLLLFVGVSSVVFALAALADRLWRGDARLRLWHWQLALAVCVVLPFAGRWDVPRVRPEVEVSTVARGVAAAAAPARGWDINWWQVAGVLLLAGVAAMLMRLAVGAVRLALYRIRAVPMTQPFLAGHVLLSEEVNGPVSYGIVRPVILLPADFESWPEARKQCVLAHEMAHVRRHDWAFGIVEELIRCVLWFHPGVWLAINRIHLAREQVVDAEALGFTGDREAYLDALLSVAGVKERLGFVPAPLFVRTRHLAMRVAHLVDEVKPMNRMRMMLSLAAGALTLAGASAILTTLMPFQAPAQEMRPQGPQPVVEHTVAAGRKLIHHVAPRYPVEAKVRRVEGVVSVELNVDAKGLVTDARVLTGPEELRRAALQAVLQWQFEATGAAARATVDLTFRMPQETGPQVGVLRSIDLSTLPEDVRKKVAARIPLKEGDALRGDSVRDVQLAVMEADARVRVALTPDMVLMASMAPMTIRVGGNVQSSKLRKKVAPMYPPTAKQARIQGTVRMEVTIDKDGKVSNVQLIGGHPLLAEAAVEAVRQWEYETTLLNGSPVDVIAQVDVNFMLSE